MAMVIRRCTDWWDSNTGTLWAYLMNETAYYLLKLSQQSQASIHVWCASKQGACLAYSSCISEHGTACTEVRKNSYQIPDTDITWTNMSPRTSFQLWDPVLRHLKLRKLWMCHMGRIWKDISCIAWSYRLIILLHVRVMRPWHTTPTSLKNVVDAIFYDKENYACP